MTIYSYNVNFFDEGEQRFVDGKEENFFEKGIILADNFSDAVKRLENYYGADNLIQILELTCEEESDGVIPDSYLIDLGYKR